MVAISGTQWATNLNAGLGNLPRSYELAAQVLAAVDGLMDKQPWCGHTLRTVGHSKGGGEATYAALVQEVPVKAEVFAPSHLSAGLIERLPATAPGARPASRAAYSVDTDLVPDAPFVPGLGIHGVGTSTSFRRPQQGLLADPTCTTSSSITGKHAGRRAGGRARRLRMRLRIVRGRVRTSVVSGTTGPVPGAARRPSPASA
jgi:hypothetical protein